MSKIQWEYDLVEKPFCEQLRAMGWQWIEGDTDVPELTERVNFREVLLKGRLEAALKRINLRDGKPWLDEARVSRAIRDLERAEGNRLMEIIPLFPDPFALNPNFSQHCPNCRISASSNAVFCHFVRYNCSGNPAIFPFT